MKKILVVEDSPTVIGAVEMMLFNHGYQVMIARDGVSALSSVRAFSPDMVLLDIMLPHVDGIEVCSIVKRNPAYQAIPVVMMSGLTEARDIQRAFDAGADDYITKPFNEDDLIHTVEQYVANGRFPMGQNRTQECQSNTRSLF